jgi:hypothetical protein
MRFMMHLLLWIEVTWMYKQPLHGLPVNMVSSRGNDTNNLWLSIYWTPIGPRRCWQVPAKYQQSHVTEGFRRGRNVVKMFWVFIRCRFLVRNQHFGTICLFHLLELKQTISPEMLVSYQKMTLGKNPKDFIQHQQSGWLLPSYPFSSL